MAKGGKREGAGRKPGSKGKKTLEKLLVIEAFNQRAMLHADALFQAQLKLATGSQRVFRIDETKDGKGNTKREHVLVTDAEEIKQLLDELEGGDGTVDGNYYYFQTVMPDNRAIDSLLNRSLGKVADKTELTGKDGGAIETATTLIIQGIPGNDGNG